MRLTIIAGLPGTGKTHLARRLERQTGALRLNRDEVRMRMFDPPDYSIGEKMRAFEEMLRLARESLTSGRDVILEGMPFSRRSERDAARRLAEEVGAAFEMIECTCPDELAIRRIKRGRHPAADRNATLYYEVKHRFEPFGDDEPFTAVHTG